MRAPVDLHERDARFDKPAGDQAALAEPVSAVSVAGFIGLAADVERGETFTRGNEGVRELVLRWSCGNRARLRTAQIVGHRFGATSPIARAVGRR